MHCSDVRRRLFTYLQDEQPVQSHAQICVPIAYTGGWSCLVLRYIGDCRVLRGFSHIYLEKKLRRLALFVFISVQRSRGHNYTGHYSCGGR